MTQWIRSAFRRARSWTAVASDDRGFAMITVIGYGTVIILITSLLSQYAMNSISGSRREQDYDAAVAAAQAGVDELIDQIRTTGTVPANTTGWTAVPGSKDPSGNACDSAFPVPVNCPEYELQTTTESNGDLTVYAAGKVRNNAERAVKVTLHKADYTDYLYYSEVEAADPQDPLAYPQIIYGANGGGQSCGYRAWSTANQPIRPSSCKVPVWRAGDTTNGSTVHSNDLITTQGSPTYNSYVTTEYDQCKPSPTNASPTCYASTTSAKPHFNDGAPTYATGQVSAPNNLKSQAVCTYTGPTRIKFVGNKMEVWSPQTQASDNPGQNCGGGLAPNLVSAINAKLGVNFSTSLLGQTVNILGSGAVSLLNMGTDQLLSTLGSVVASDPTPVPIPSVIYVRNNPNNGSSPAPTGIECLLGKTLGLYGTLDPNPTTLLTNPEEINNCGSGELYTDGAFNGRSTIGTDGNVTIMSDLYYSNSSGTTSPGQGHNLGDSLGIVSNGFVDVWSPVQCTLALTTCLSVNPDNVTPLKALGQDIHVEAAIMTQHSFGVSLPLTQLSAYASLLNGVLTASIPTPNIDLYGSVYQYYRGTLGADLLGANVNVDEVNVASANVKVGYYANYTYDQHLRTTPPPDFPTPANPTWVQDTFAEIPVGKLPSGF